MSKQRVKFVDAPPPIGGPQDPRSVWMERLSVLVERPGEWAEIYSGTPSSCHQAAAAMKLRQYWIPPGGWDFTVRSFRRGHRPFAKEDHIVAVLYARYLGPDADAFHNWSEAYNHSADAVWDQYGRRLCPVCKRHALVLEGAGSYPAACDECSLAAAPEGVEHGREVTYRKKGCRCSECRRAARLAHRGRVEAKRMEALR